MESVYHVLRVMFDNIRIGQDGNPVAIRTLGCFDTIHTETARQTSDTTKDRFEGLGLMVRDVVFKDCKCVSM
jgi:hypothetical protein